jgi:hypothetical protein|tara:strand:- start:10 stop:564 length:555 start_codon:yes stop_codon:yes gene_type:complete
MARGKHSKAISDRSGMEFPYLEMMKEWNGSFVHRSEFESKHPQLEIRAKHGDEQGLMNARPARTENSVIILLNPDPFKTIAASSGIINVSEQSHGRSTGDTVRFRGALSTSAAFNNPKTFDGIAATNLAKAAGYSITVGKRDSSGNVTQTADFYHFTVDTNTATSGNISGGGENCSAGPATLTA